jgi:hypothetical protein
MATQDYEAAITLANGLGYWVYYLLPTTVTINGPEMGPLAVPAILAGWLLLGSCDTVLQVSSLTLSNDATIYGSAFRYDPVLGDYQPTTMIYPGEAVWIYVTKPCTITFP